MRNWTGENNNLMSVICVLQLYRYEAQDGPTDDAQNNEGREGQHCEINRSQLEDLWSSDGPGLNRTKS